jgi:hypothetical protein
LAEGCRKPTARTAALQVRGGAAAKVVPAQQSGAD